MSRITLKRGISLPAFDLPATMGDALAWDEERHRRPLCRKMTVDNLFGSEAGDTDDNTSHGFVAAAADEAGAPDQSELLALLRASPIFGTCSEVCCARARCPAARAPAPPSPHVTAAAAPRPTRV